MSAFDLGKKDQVTLEIFSFSHYNTNVYVPLPFYDSLLKGEENNDCF